MKVLTTILLMGLLATTMSFALGSPQTVVQTEYVSVTVSPIALLSAPASLSATLSAVRPDSTTYGRSVITQCQGAGLMFTQNSGTKKIVAEAVHEVGNVTNDMLISCSVDEQAPVILVNNGQDTGPQDLWSGIAPGGYDEPLTWTFDGSVGGTPSGAYAWTVTFTAMEDAE